MTNSIEELINKFSGQCGIVFAKSDGTILYKYDKDSLFSTASVIKIYVLGALLDLCQQRKKNLSELICLENREHVIGTGVLKELDLGIKLRVKDFAVLMIIISDNVATNLLIDYLGGINVVNNFIYKCGLSHTILNRKICADAAKEKDELGISTPYETFRFLMQIYHESILNKDYTNLFFDILKKQQLKDSFLRNLEFTYNDLDYTGLNQFKLCGFASKTGAITGVRNDCGILYGKKNDYIYSVFTKECKDTKFYCDNEANIFLGRIGQVLAEKYCY